MNHCCPYWMVATHTGLLIPMHSCWYPYLVVDTRTEPLMPTLSLWYPYWTVDTHTELLIPILNCWYPYLTVDTHTELLSFVNVGCTNLTYLLYSYGGNPIFERDGNKFVIKLKDGKRLPRPEACPTEVNDLMKDCWKFVQDERPSFRQCIERYYNFIDTDCHSAKLFTFKSFIQYHSSIFCRHHVR